MLYRAVDFISMAALEAVTVFGLNNDGYVANKKSSANISYLAKFQCTVKFISDSSLCRCFGFLASLLGTEVALELMCFIYALLFRHDGFQVNFYCYFYFTLLFCFCFGEPLRFAFFFMANCCWIKREKKCDKEERRGKIANTVEAVVVVMSIYVYYTFYTIISISNP